MAKRKTTSDAGAARPKAARKPRKAKPEPGSRGLKPAELTGEAEGAAAQLAQDIQADGGVALSAYREPLGGHFVVFAGLPIDKVEPTPYQRDVSETHVKRLASAFERVGRYLDPIVAVRHDGKYWTPNGSHRLSTAKAMGMKSIVALVMPEPEVAFQILALNTEKAHNLKERALEVIRMYRGLVGARGGEKESEFASVFEEASFATLGAAYEKRPRYSAGAYNPVVRRVEAFSDQPLTETLKTREAHAETLLELDDVVVGIVDALKKKGLASPYLKNFVVARINPLKGTRGTGEGEFDKVVGQMLESARRFDVAQVRKEDLSAMGGAPAEAEE